jgi:hypothetical protein
MAYEEIVQTRAIMEADIQKDSGKTLRLFTIHALFPLSFFTESLHISNLQACTPRFSAKDIAINP